MSLLGRGVVDFGRVNALLLAMVHLVEAVEAGLGFGGLRRRRKGGRVGVDRMGDHLTRANEGSTLKRVEVVDELRRALILDDGRGINDVVGREEDGVVG